MPVMATDEPLILHVKPGKMKRGGWGAIVLGAFLTGPCVLSMIYGERFPAFLSIILVFGVLLMVFGVLNLGIGRGRPVGLRIDAHGLSGYYVPTLDWTEVVRFDLTEPGSGMLGIELFDRDALRARQRSVMWRFNLRLPLGGNWHIVVPGEVLEGDLDDIVTRAQAFQAAAIARDRRKTSM